MVDLLVTGHVSTLDSQLAATTGGMYLTNSPTITTQAAAGLRVYDQSGNGLRYLQAGTQAGYSNKVFSTYSGSTELLRIGHLNAAIQTIIPQKNDGQTWIYSNSSTYESGGLQAAFKFEYPRFRRADDNVASLGYASNRWTTVFATTGTINTSDEREKTAKS